MEQNKTTASAKKFKDMLLSDYYLNTIEQLANESKLSDDNEIKGFLNSICSNEEKQEFNGTFDNYLNNIISNKEQKK